VRVSNEAQLLESNSARRAQVYLAVVRQALRAYARSDGAAMIAVEKRARDVVTETMAMGEVYGAIRAMREVASVVRRDGMHFAPVHRAERPGEMVIPRVTLPEALADMIERAPVTLRAGAERVAQQIADLYSTDHVVAFARALTDAATEKGREIIVRGLEQGIGEIDAGRMMAQANDWAESYARMAFRTNVNTATTAGRFRQARDPDVRAVTPAFRFDAVNDGDVRDNHVALNGLIFATDSPVWRRIAPPLGYNCRCRVSLMSTVLLRRLGRLGRSTGLREDTLPAGAGPDPGFRTAPRVDLL
jgi:SPP1 gp7 family putative phage head morphogenesis protein